MIQHGETRITMCGKHTSESGSDRLDTNFWLRTIANELAEANRLKRLKIKLEHGSMSTSTYLKEVRDQAV